MGTPIQEGRIYRIFYRNFLFNDLLFNDRKNIIILGEFNLNLMSSVSS